jgi:BRCA1 C Terminus (BRCT) domain
MNSIYVSFIRLFKMLSKVCFTTLYLLNVSLEREEAEDLIKRHGGRVTGSVSKKTVNHDHDGFCCYFSNKTCCSAPSFLSFNL